MDDSNAFLPERLCLFLTRNPFADILNISFQFLGDILPIKTKTFLIHLFPLLIQIAGKYRCPIQPFIYLFNIRNPARRASARTGVSTTMAST